MKTKFQNLDLPKRTFVLAHGKVWMLEDGKEPIVVGEMSGAMAQLVLGRWFGHG